MVKQLNENDEKLLGFCYGRRRHISEIAREIGIDVKNVSVRVPILEHLGLIKTELIGNKKYVRTIGGDKTTDYFIEILKKIKENKGELKYDDYITLVPFNPNDIDDDKYSAPLKLLWIQPKLVEQYVKITPDGLKFIEDVISLKKIIKETDPEINKITKETIEKFDKKIKTNS